MKTIKIAIYFLFCYLPVAFASTSIKSKKSEHDSSAQEGKAISGKKPSRGTDTYKSIIQKAQELSLNQERVKAVQLLVSEIERDQKNQSAQQSLKKTLANLSEIFYTEKAQSTFEMGRSLSLKTPEAGIDKFTEALALEPDNIKIMRELAKEYLVSGECQKALDLSRKALMQNPYNSDFFLLRLQSKVCLGNVEDIEAELANPYIVGSEKETLGPYINLIITQYYFSQQKYNIALNTVSKIKQAEFPEPFYWKGMIKMRLGQSPVSEFESYVDLCKEKAGKSVPRFPLEPRTCRELKSIEQKLEQLKSESAG